MKTTRESAREASHKEMVDGLQELLEKNYDAEKEYKNAREQAENPVLKEFFKKQAVRKNHFATEIDRYIHSLNAEPKEKGTPMGALHRTWVNLRSMFDKDSDQVLLKECHRGEKNSIEEYESTMKKTRFTSSIEQMLRTHISEMRGTLSEIKDMEGMK